MADNRPNIVFVLADNVGWADWSCYGGGTPTPHIDKRPSRRRGDRRRHQLGGADGAVGVPSTAAPHGQPRSRAAARPPGQTD